MAKFEALLERYRSLAAAGNGSACAMDGGALNRLRLAVVGGGAGGYFPNYSKPEAITLSVES